MWGNNEQQLLVEIPDNLNQLKRTQPDVALQWRLKTRIVFTTLFAQGYTVVDFVSGIKNKHRRNWYVLKAGV